MTIPRGGVCPVVSDDKGVTSLGSGSFVAPASDDMVALAAIGAKEGVFPLT